MSFLADSACSSNLSHDISVQYFNSLYHVCCDIRAPGEANDKDAIEPANTHSDENDLVGPHDISAMCDGNDINVSTMPVNSRSMAVNSHSMPVNSHSMPENSHTDDNDPAVQLKTFKAKHAKNLIISQYNVNSIRYKFSEQQHILQGHFVDILGIAETKIDDIFDGQFQMENYKLYRQDRNDRGGGIMMIRLLRLMELHLPTDPLQNNTTQIRTAIMGPRRFSSSWTMLTKPWSNVIYLQVLMVTAHLQAPCVWTLI